MISPFGTIYVLLIAALLLAISCYLIILEFSSGNPLIRKIEGFLTIFTGNIARLQAGSAGYIAVLLLFMFILEFLVVLPVILFNPWGAGSILMALIYSSFILSILANAFLKWNDDKTISTVMKTIFLNFKESFSANTK